MPFEFDSKKSEKNKEKHGIDFIEAQTLWDDLYGLTIDAKSETENRSALIARHKGKTWTAFYTMRNNNIRLISVRRSREKEERLYYES